MVKVGEEKYAIALGSIETIEDVLPSPYLVLTSTSPPRASIFDFTTSRPTPRPDTSVTLSDVEKLGSIETIEDVPVSEIKYVHAKEVINLRGNEFLL